MKKTTKTKTAAKKKMEKEMRDFEHEELLSAERGPLQLHMQKRAKKQKRDKRI